MQLTPGQNFTLLTGLVVLLAAPLRADDSPRRTPHVAPVLTQADGSNSAGSESLRSGDRAFILQGLNNSRSEAELSRLAVSQATSSEVRDFAQQLVSDYGEINNALESLARRKAVAVPVQPTSFSDDYRHLAEQSGAAFDHAFVRQIAATNERALRICEAAVADAKDADVRALAGSLLPVIRGHVNTTRDLLKNL